MVNSVPPPDVEGAIWVGALKGELGAEEPNPVFAPPNVTGVVACGKLVLPVAGDAGWLPKPKGVLEEGAPKLNAEDWKVEGLLGADPPAGCPNGLLAGGVPKLKPDVVEVGVPPKLKEPVVEGRGLSVGLVWPKEKPVLAVDAGGWPNEKGFDSSDLDSLMGWGAKGFEEGVDPKGNGVVVAGGADEGPPNRTEPVVGGLPNVNPPKAGLLLPLSC